MTRKSAKPKVRQKKWLEMSKDELIERLRSERRASKQFRELWQRQVRENAALAPAGQDPDAWKWLPEAAYAYDGTGVLDFAEPLDESTYELVAQALERWALDSAVLHPASEELDDPPRELALINRRIREWIAAELSARPMSVDLGHQGEPLFWLHAAGSDKALALVIFDQHDLDQLRVFGPMRVDALTYWLQMLDPHETDHIDAIERIVAETLGSRFRAREHLVAFVSNLFGDVWREAVRRLAIAQRTAPTLGAAQALAEANRSDTV